MRPHTCLVSKIRTRSVAPFEPGKACRPVIGVSLIALLALIEASRAIWSRWKEKCTSCNVGWSDGTRARGLLRDRAEVCWEFQVAVKTAADRAN